MSKPLGGDELLAAVMRWEGRLDELMADVGEAAEIYGTDSPEHLAAIAAWEQHTFPWPEPGPGPEADHFEAEAGVGEPELEADL
jgi:hypothetical protein